MQLGLSEYTGFNDHLLLTKKLKKKDREFSKEVINAKGAVVLFKWQDNKPIFMGSNFTGIKPENEVKRWDEVGKKFNTIRRPQIMKLFNQGMDGVDKFGQLLSYYRIHIKLYF